VIHQIVNPHPRPSGWRASCTCGWWTRGHTRAEVEHTFLEHAECEHLVDISEVEDQ
jgi:predicted small metal-binding protein